MFVIISLQKIGGQYNEKLVEINGLSTDEKPLKKIGNILIKNGSTFLEIDTGKKYKFDSENKKWYEVDSKIVSSGGEYQAVEKLEVKLRNNYYTKNEVNATIIGVITPTGVVNSVSDLKEVVSPQVGDIYKVDDTNKNYGFDGTNWQPVVSNAEILNMISPLEDSTTWGTFTKD